MEARLSVPARGASDLPDAWDRRARQRFFAGGSPENSRRRPNQTRGLEGVRALSPLRASPILQRFSRVSPQKQRANRKSFASNSHNSMAMVSFSSGGSVVHGGEGDGVIGGSELAARDDARSTESPTAASGVLSSWGPQWACFDFMRHSDSPVTALLAKARQSLQEKWVVGPASTSAINPPPLELRTKFVAKILSQCQLEALMCVCGKTRPLVFVLEGFRVSPAQKGLYGNLAALEACFNCPDLRLMKDSWLSQLGEEAADLELRLYDRGLSGIAVELGRVGVEWMGEVSTLAEELNRPLVQKPIAITFDDICIVEDVAAGRLRPIPLSGVVEESDTRKAGWMSLIISDALDKLGPPGQDRTHHFATYESPGPKYPGGYGRRQQYGSDE